MFIAMLGKVTGAAPRAADPLTAEADRRIESFLDETTGQQYWDIKVKDYPSGRAILEAPPELQVATVKAAYTRMQRSGLRWDTKAKVRQLLTPLFARSLPYTAADLEFLLDAALKDGHYYGDWGGVLRQIGRYKEKEKDDLTPAMREAPRRRPLGPAGWQRGDPGARRAPGRTCFRASCRG